ncbi:RRM domain-containing protein [Heracleum sosnowskyi]|uniref:RRM domain-containing protein n=1 Tax=Heracleum sosnowskyi TaxID=360622 RepID=A0AAD8MUS7_9APIA|nr:RRM domain-containing protein [Heracleum sosnowskyi]
MKIITTNDDGNIVEEAFAAGFRANSKELQTQANGDGKPATGAKTTGTEQVGGRTVKVNFPEVPRGGEREVMGPKIRSSYQSFVDIPHKLYAGNLSWSVTSQQLKEFFADQPGLLSAKVIYDRQSGRSQGYGFITFESAESIEAMT